MKPNSILYYPHIEFQNEAWIKSSLLLWDHVYRIVPEGYSPNDSDEIKALVDEDLVRDIKLDDKDREDTFEEFLKLCDRIENRMPAGLIPSDEDRIHPGKIDNRLYLHAYSIEFKNPSDNKMRKLYAKLSGNFKDALIALFDDKIVNKYVK